MDIEEGGKRRVTDQDLKQDPARLGLVFAVEGFLEEGGLDLPMIELPWERKQGSGERGVRSLNPGEGSQLCQNGAHPDSSLRQERQPHFTDGKIEA